jgi:hypothetical protein
MFYTNDCSVIILYSFLVTRFYLQNVTLNILHNDMIKYYTLIHRKVKLGVHEHNLPHFDA